MLEGRYERITTNLQATLPEKCKVSVYPDQKALHKMVGKSYAISSMTGITDEPNGFKIVCPHFQNYPENLPVHEFAHVVVNQIVPDANQIPSYLNEGVAAYEAGKQAILPSQ